MEASEIFYITGTVALIIVSAFIISLIYALYRITRMAKTGLNLLNFASRDVRNSIGNIARGWSNATILSMAFRIIRAFWRR